MSRQGDQGMTGWNRRATASRVTAPHPHSSLISFSSALYIKPLQYRRIAGAGRSILYTQSTRWTTSKVSASRSADTQRSADGWSLPLFSHTFTSQTSHLPCPPRLPIACTTLPPCLIRTSTLRACPASVPDHNVRCQDVLQSGQECRPQPLRDGGQGPRGDKRRPLVRQLSLDR